VAVTGGAPVGTPTVTSTGLVPVRGAVTDVVEDQSENRASGRLQPVRGPFQVGPVGLALAGDHDRAMGQAAQDRGVRCGQHRGSVEQDDVGQQVQLVEHGLHAGTVEQLTRVVTIAADRKQLESVDPGLDQVAAHCRLAVRGTVPAGTSADLLALTSGSGPGVTGSALDLVVGFSLLPVGLDQVGQPGTVGALDAEHLLEARPPEIGGDDDDPTTGERPRHRQVRGHERLAVARLGAGHHHERTLVVDQQHAEAGPQVAHGLGQ